MRDKRSALPFAAFILAGGLGLRLRPVISDRPKPMAAVGETPFLEMLIHSLGRKGVSEFVLLTGFRGEMIEDHFRRLRPDGVSIEFSQEAVPLGTGGAVKLAERFATDPTLLVNGDTFFDADLEALHRFHVETSAQVSLSLYEVDDVSRYGTVNVDSSSRITGFSEKSQSGGRGLINAGLSLLSADFIKGLPEGSYSMEQDIFPKFVSTGNMFGLCQDRPFFDIGTPESYEAFKAFVHDSMTWRRLQ